MGRQKREEDKEGRRKGKKKEEGGRGERGYPNPSSLGLKTKL